MEILHTTNTRANLGASGASPSAFIKFTLLNLIILAVEFGDRNFLVSGAAAAAVAEESENEAAIELIRFQVPAQVRANEFRRLSCQFKLHGATLHALKLFKDDHEFYRLAQNNQKMSFPVPGVHVDLGRSREGDVWLKMTRNSGGLYKCQVLIEGTFKSVSMAKRLEVKEAAPKPISGPSGANSSSKSNQSGPWQHSPVQQRHLYSFGVSNTGHARRGPPPSWLLLTAAVAVVSALLLVCGPTGLAAGEEIERWRRKSRPNEK